jgi:hypothetical protein
LDVGILGGVVRSNGLPSGHTNLNGGHPSLKENLFERVLVIEVPSAPFRPEVVEEKATEDVQGLSKVGETAGVVREEPGGVIFSLGGRLPKKDERSGDGDVLKRIPFGPYFFVSFPGALCHGAFEQTVLWRFLGS